MPAFGYNTLLDVQPAAVDLRLVTSAIKINAELERIADQAVNISQNTMKLLQCPPPPELVIIPRMAEIAGLKHLPHFPR